MTDLATKPTDASNEPARPEPAVEWIAPEPKKRSSRKLWLGIGLPAVALVACGALAVVGTTFTAPGVTVLGADVGTQTLGSVEATIADVVADTTITIDVDGESATFTGDELGLTVDAAGAAQTIADAHRLWQVGGWNPGAIDADVSVDQATATDALAERFADSFVDPVNAQIAFADGAYTVVPSEKGQGIDTEALAATLTQELANAQPVQALASGETVLAAGSAPSISIDASITETDALFTTEEAQAAADKLNGAAQGVSFTLDGDTVAEVAPDQVAQWLDVSVSEEGDVDVTANADEIQAYAATLPEKVDQEPVDADVVVDAAGEITKVIEEGQDGYRVTSTDGIGEQIAASLTALEPAEVALQGEKVAHETTKRYRHAVVALSEGYSYFYESVDGGEDKLMKKAPMAIGRDGFDTLTGDYSVGWQTPQQNMGSCDAEGNYVPGGAFDYCTANVKFATYFNGDQAFHGTYWHNNFGPGARMSHGCVNLTEADAEWVYYFLQAGSGVSVRA